jgi:polysaccharide deacetylase 2 family uncharacterized protein YibQ
MTRKKQRFSKKKHTPKHFFVFFIAIALITVVLLEYIDFKNGKKSFIFTQLIPLKKHPGKIEQFNTNFLRVLNKNNIDCDYFQDEEEKYHFKMQIDAPRFNGLVSKLKEISRQLKAKVELSEIQGKTDRSIMLYKITMEKKVSHLILITKLKKPTVQAKKIEPKEEKKPGIKTKTIKSIRHREPKIAFIIDDVGAYDIGARELKKLDIPISPSILPDSPRAGEEAHRIQQYGLPAMLHIPMQPKNGNGQTYGRDHTITMNSTDDEIRQLIRRAKQIVPFARGVNNHQGSLLTTDSQMMTRVLKIIKEEGLFFVDSRTIGNTVGYETAKRLGIKTAYKDVFLDHIKTYSHSLTQIRRLVEIALQKGKAIAIGHPNKSTLKAIRDSVKYIRAKGVKIVYVSELLE